MMSVFYTSPVSSSQVAAVMVEVIAAMVAVIAAMVVETAVMEEIGGIVAATRAVVAAEVEDTIETGKPVVTIVDGCFSALVLQV